MKKFIATVVALVVLSMAALPATAQTRRRCSNRTVYNTRYEDRYGRDSRYDSRVYTNDVYNDDYRYDDGYYRDNRSVWEKHRDKITTAGGAVGGAVIGGLVGGKKGAIIGAITGGAGAAVYTYKVRDRNGRY